MNIQPDKSFLNAHEMFLLNADTIRLDSPFTFGVLAHEFSI